jgi:hypothetical protein
VIGASRLYYSDVNLPGPYLDLAGRPVGALYDVYRHLASGNLLTEVAPVMEVLLTGTPIGGMNATSGAGGIAAAFDGNLDKPYLACAKSPGAVTGYQIDGAIGLGLSSPKVVNRIAITAPNDNGFRGDNLSTPWQLLGGNGGNYATASVITNAPRTPPYVAGLTGRIEIDFPNGVAFNSLWWNGWGNGVNAIRACQVQFYSTLPMSARGLTTTAGMTVNDHAMTAMGNSGPIICNIGACEFLGQVQIDPAGGATLNKSYGLDRRCSYWNAKNQVPLILKAGDPSPANAGHFIYTPLASGDYQMSPVQGTGLMRATFLNGMADNDAKATFDQCVFQNDAAAVTAYWCSVNSSKNTPAGKWGVVNLDSLGTQEGEFVQARHIFAPSYGPRTVYALEGARGNISGFYGEGNQDLVVEAHF